MTNELVNAATAKRQLGYNIGTNRADFEKRTGLKPHSLFKSGRRFEPLYLQSEVDKALPCGKKVTQQMDGSLVYDLLSEIQKNVTAIHIRLDRIEVNQKPESPAISQ